VTTFQDLGVSAPILKALDAEGYTKPTPIQMQALPIVQRGRDLVGLAQTGTGKTAAFALPILDRLNANRKHAGEKSCRALVLAPTRELAAQIADSFRTYGRFLGLSTAVVFGGASMFKQKQALYRGVDILVATPGRLLDLIDQRALTLRHVEIFVLDEADQMMDLGFIVPLKRVANMLPKERQSLFFSATMPKAIRQLADQYLTDPAQVSVAPQATTAERVEQQVAFCQNAEKQAFLTILLRDGFASKQMDRVLVFTRTKHGADRVVKKLFQSGIRANAIHGNKSQPQREKALGEFRQGHVKILVATDIAARGIDVSGISHVVNFELPNVAEQYVHRIGRTARAGAAGVAISLCAPDEKAYLRDIWKLTRANLEEIGLPEGLAAEARIVNAKVPGEAQAERQERRDYSAEQRRRFPPRKKAQVHAKPRGGESHPAQGQKAGGNNPNRRRFNKQRRSAG
jgi:ATP-dependent RNA helicase RhlE